MTLILFLLSVVTAILLRNHLLGLLYALVYVVLLAGSYSIVWIIVALFINRS